MSEKPVDYGREVRDTVVKSSLTGVAATVLAVTVFSPAGFGGIIGTSLASSFGGEANASHADDNAYANLPAFPAPLSQAELTTIHSQLARTTASLEFTRAATQERIDHIRAIALTERDMTPMRQTASVGEGLRLTMSEPEPFVATSVPMPAPLEQVTAVSYSDANTAYRDPHLELAELLLARDSL